MAYDKLWDAVHAEREWGMYPKEELVRWASKNLNKGQKVLDLGCGQGASTWFLAREGMKVSAVDGSMPALTKMIARLSKENLLASICCTCFTQLPYSKDYFDAVVDVVSSVHNPASDVKLIFNEMHRVLAPGGKLFSVIPTSKCSREPFKNLKMPNYMKIPDVQLLLGDKFVNVNILKSSYQLDAFCTVENWIVTGEKLKE